MPPSVLHLLALVHAEVSGVISTGVAVASKAPPPWAALLAGAGILFLMHGARHRLVLAVPGGAALGLLAARLAMDVLEAPGTPLPPAAWWAAGGVGALASAAWPPIFPPLVLAVPGALIGLQFPIAMRPWLGAVAGALAGGALGALVREWVAALAAGGIGAAALLGGAIGLLAKRPIAVELGGHPMVLLAAWSVFAVSGAAFHAGRAWPSEGAKGRGDPASPQSSGGPSSSKSGISSFR